MVTHNTLRTPQAKQDISEINFKLTIAFDLKQIFLTIQIADCTRAHLLLSYHVQYGNHELDRQLANRARIQVPDFFFFIILIAKNRQKCI